MSQLDMFSTSAVSAVEDSPRPTKRSQGADTPGQRESVAAGNVADPHSVPTDHRDATAEVTSPKRPTIDERFAEFSRANPHVFDELKRLAMAKLAEGGKRIGVKALWEDLRASLIRIDDGGGPAYKLNNDFTALYARMLIDRYPELSAVIEVRRRKDER